MVSSLSEAYREHPLHLHHIIPLDFSSVSTLPDSHAWSPLSNDHDDDDAFNGSSCSSIPMIDLMDPNAMELMGHACEEWGAFQLKNHGIPFSVIQEVEGEAKRLFALPAHRKLKALRSPGGATGYGRARISPFFPKLMWHEGYTIMGSPSDDAKKIWPHDYTRFCDLMENYQKQMKGLAEKLTQMMLGLLGINNCDEEKKKKKKKKKKWVIGNSSSNNNPNCGAVQLNFYPRCPEPNRAMGLAPHTDTSLFTILHQSQTKGLQIFKEGKGWVPIHPPPNNNNNTNNYGTLLVHTGDLLHILSNARFQCALHRVTVNNTRHRYSVAYFYCPPLDCVVSPLDNIAPRFRAVTVKEYIGIKAKNFGDALSLIST